MTDILEIFNFVATSIWSVAPVFILSISLGVLVQALKMDTFIHQAFSHSAGIAIVLATLVGAFSPLCSCTVIPVVTGLLLSGVPLAPVMAFWVASPTMDPEIFALTVGVLGWPLAIVRLLATLVLSLGAGYLTLAFTRSGVFSDVLLRQPKSAIATEEECGCSPTALTPEPQAVFASIAPLPVMAGNAGAACAAGGGGCGSGPIAPAASDVPWHVELRHKFRHLDRRQFGRDVVTESWKWGRWLVVAFLMEALIIRYVPQAAIAGVLGGGNAFAVPLAALVGIPLYLSNISALPIVSGLMAQGMQPGAVIAFLVAGPVTTIPAMTAVWAVVRRRVFALYLAVGLLGAMVMGWLTNLVL